MQLVAQISNSKQLVGYISNSVELIGKISDSILIVDWSFFKFNAASLKGFKLKAFGWPNHCSII